MRRSATLTFGFFMIVLYCLFAPGGMVIVGVTVYDTVTLPATPVYIKVLTKGRLFPAGGQRVRIQTDNRVLGQILTGGDGYGFLKTQFLSPGSVQVTAESESDRASGTVLVVPPEHPLILVEIQGVSLTGAFFEGLSEDAREVLETLSKSYGLIYLAGGFGINGTRQFIRTKRFPPSVVIPYRGRKTFTWLTKKGLNVYAAVGSPKFVDAADGLIERRISVNGTTGKGSVKSWKELPSLLEE